MSAQHLGDLSCYSAAGVKQAYRKPGTGGTGAGAGVTLVNGNTYYFPLGTSDARVVGLHLKGDAAIIITSATLQSSCFPKDADGIGGLDVADFDATAGNWIPEDPASAVAEVVGAGWAQAAGVVSVAGGAAGGASWQIGNPGSKRWRLAVVVGGTGGVVRVAAHGRG